MSDKAKTFIDQAALDNKKIKKKHIIGLKQSAYLSFVDAGFDKKEALELCKDVI